MKGQHFWRNPVILAALLLALLVFISHIRFLTAIDGDVVRGDYWRFLALIEDYHRGSLTFDALLDPVNGPIKSLFIPLTILGTGVLFDLNLDVIHLSACLLALVASIFVLHLCWRWAPDTAPQFRLVQLTAPLVVLSPTWYPLITHGQGMLSVARAAFFVMSFAATGHALLEASGWKRRVLLAAVTILLSTSFFAHSYAPAYVAALAVLLAIAWAVPEPRVRASAAVLSLVLTLGVILLLVCLLEVKPRDVQGVSFLWSHPWLHLKFFLMLYGRSFLGAAPDSSHEMLWLTAGGFSFALNVAALAFVLFRGSRPARALALPFLVYSPCVIALITATRTSHGPGVALAKRYLADTPLWVVGALWALAELSIHVGSEAGWRSRYLYRVSLLLLVVLSGSVLARGVLDAKEQWEQAPYVQRVMEGRRLAILHSDELSDEELQQALWATPTQMRYVRGAIATMRRYCLNVFHTSTPCEVLRR